jgi:hypothetical protein
MLSPFCGDTALATSAQSTVNDRDADQAPFALAVPARTRQ